MKIAFAVINANRFEGTSRAVLEVAERLAENHDVDIWARTIEEKRSDRIKWVRVRGIPRPEVLDFATYKWNVDARLQRSNYDIVHAAGPNTQFADVYAIQTVHPVKMQLTELGRSAANATWLRRASWRAYDEAVVRAETKCYQANGPRGPRAFLPVSQGTMAELVQHYPNTQTDDSVIEVVPNGADLTIFNPQNKSRFGHSIRQAVGLADTDFVLVFSGGDWRRKGLDILLEAMSRIDEPKIKLMVVGSDRGGESIRTAARSLEAQRRVFFVGFQKNVEHYYAAADLFVFPTSYEAFSVASIEAAASGLPVIMSHVSGAQELVGSGEAGTLVARTSDSYAREILKYFHNPELLRDKSKSARALVEREFSWDSVARRTVTVYESLLAQRTKSRQ